MKKILCVLIFIPFIILSAQSITGKVLGFDGKPLAKANIQILSNESSQAVLNTFDVNKDGSFEVPVKLPFYHRVRFCGVGHEPLDVPIMIESGSFAGISVNLKSNFSKKTGEPVLIGDFNNWAFSKNSKKMTKTGDGIYEAYLKASADTLSYQVLGLNTKGSSINWKQADYFCLDSGGDYRSVLKTKAGDSVKIVIDLNTIPSGVSPEIVQFADTESEAYTFYSALNDYNASRDKMSKAYTEYIKNGGDKGKFKYDYSADIEALKKKGDAQTNDRLKGYYYWAMVNLAPKNTDKEICRFLLKTFSPTSLIWVEHGTFSASKIMSDIYTQEEMLNFYMAVVDNHSDETIKPQYIYSVLNYAKELGKNDIIKKYYSLMVEKYPKSPDTQMAQSRYAPDRAIQVGKEIPDFDFELMDDHKTRVSKKSMMGKTYLIDFWATWCGPCVGEMENMHKVYEKFKDKGFTIVSFSMDFNIDDPVKFRKDKWAMPWYNIFLVLAKEQPFIKSFEVVAIPKPILVGADGKILATEDNLRGENLSKTVEKYFK